MIKFEEKITTEEKPHTTLILGKDQREKSRLKVILDDGREAGLFFEKGVTFQNGDLIVSNDGSIIVEIKAATETISTVKCDDPLQLAKACYHLGNRHVPLQINATTLHYQHDHVLDEMVRGLGLEVICEDAPFEPESGAYSVGSHGGGGHHSHGDDDYVHPHEHKHEHSHTHD